MTAAAPAQAAEEAKEAAPKEHMRLSSIPKPDGSLLAEAAKEDEAKERHTARLAQIDALLKQRTAARKEGGTNPEQAATKAKLVEVQAVFSKRSVRGGRQLRRQRPFAAVQQDRTVLTNDRSPRRAGGAAGAARGAEVVRRGAREGEGGGGVAEEQPQVPECGRHRS